VEDIQNWKIFIPEAMEGDVQIESDFVKVIEFDNGVKLRYSRFPTNLPLA
jgi:hypothetical protein